jgi:hypothetical protein
MEEMERRYSFVQSDTARHIKITSGLMLKLGCHRFKGAEFITKNNKFSIEQGYTSKILKSFKKCL